MIGLGLARSKCVAIYLEKRFETVIANFGAPRADGVFVPVNPLLKPDQVAFILQDCNVRVQVTSPERLATLKEALAQCPDLRHVVVTDGANTGVKYWRKWANQFTGRRIAGLGPIQLARLSGWPAPALDTG